MRNNFFAKTLAVSTVSGLMLVGGAGMASADVGDSVENQVDGSTTEVNDNRLVNVGDVSLDNLLNDAVDVGDVASGNNVLSGIDTGISDNLNGTLSGNDADVDANPDVDSTVDADTDATTGADGSVESNTDNESLLGGLL